MRLGIALFLFVAGLLTIVMAGHVRAPSTSLLWVNEDVDHRDKPGDDGV